MSYIKNKQGITLIEVLFVLAIIGVVITITGAISANFAERRSVDRVTMAISSTLYITKLKALRHGLEYQTVLTFDPINNTLNISMERGNSNKKSNSYEQETSQTIRVKEGIAITPATKKYNFNPNGTLGGASGTVTISPTDAESIRRCGRIVVSPFGRMRVIQGNWDEGTANCKPVK